ncbi:hypothetical protein KPATCC21470_2974 [Kitasatospora purpeofusca]
MITLIGSQRNVTISSRTAIRERANPNGGPAVIHWNDGGPGDA